MLWCPCGTTYLYKYAYAYTDIHVFHAFHAIDSAHICAPVSAFVWMLTYTTTGRRQKGVIATVETSKSFRIEVVLQKYIYTRMPMSEAILWNNAIRPSSSGPKCSSFVMK